MSAIQNRKKSPLSINEMIEVIPNGIAILECDDGICRVAEKSGLKSSDSWWVDLRRYFKGRFLPMNPSLQDREPLENHINSYVYELDIKFTISLG